MRLTVSMCIFFIKTQKGTKANKFMANFEFIHQKCNYGLSNLKINKI